MERNLECAGCILVVDEVRAIKPHLEKYPEKPECKINGERETFNII